MSGLSARPRKFGYALMALSGVVMACARGGLLDEWRGGAVTALVLILGAVGMMLVFTDLMVRGLYAQLDAAKDRPETAVPEKDGDPN